MTAAAVSAEAREVHAAAPLVDLHCDSILQWRYLRLDLARRLPAPLTNAAAGPEVAEQLMLAAHAA